MQKIRWATALFILLVGMCGTCLCGIVGNSTTPIQIKSGVVFQIPLTDGKLVPARCEVVEGKARLTYIYNGQFMDLQLTPWGDTPNPPDPPDPPDPPVVNPYHPSPEWQVYCEPLTKFSLSRADANMVSAFYSSMGDDVAKTDSKIVTSEQLRAALILYGREMGIKGKYAGLREAMETTLTDSLTKDIYTLDKSKTKSLLQTIAWALFESGGKK